MMTLLILILVCQSFNLLGQENLSDNNLVSNQSNINLSPFKLNDMEKPYKHFIELDISYIGLGKYHNASIAKILQVDEYKLNTALEFQLEGNDNLHYYYPIDYRTFNWKYFEENVSQKEGPQKVKIYYTFFRTNKESIIVINCIK